MDSFHSVRRFYLTSHRGNKRVWLEGEALEQSGFSPSARYDRTINPDGTITLEVSDSGAFVVSQKKAGEKTSPVIDIGNKQITELLDGSVAIEVVYKENRLLIRKSELDRKIQQREARFLQRVKAKAPLETGSLYHGGGILDSGFHEGLRLSKVPAQVQIAVEIEQKYLETSMRNNTFWGDHAWAVNSPMELTFTENSSMKLDVLTMGIPCTGASLAGMAKNKLDIPEEHKSAGAQFYYALKWIENTNPAIVVIENVPQYEKTAAWVTIKSVLNNLAYDVQTRVFSGHDFGAVEDRNRFIAVGVSHGIQRSLNFDLSKVSPRISAPPSLQSILDNVPLDSPLWRKLDYLHEKEERDLSEGKGFRLQWLNPEQAETIGTIGRGYAKYRSTEPMIVHPTDPSLVRLLTPLEHARAKTIPESAIAGVDSTTIAHEILGQSVVREWFVCIGSNMGERIHSLENVRQEKTIDRRGDGYSLF